MHLTIKNQIVNRNSMPLSVRKMSLQIVQRLSQTNAKTSCLDLTPGHFDTAKRGNFLLQEEVGGIDWIKTPKNHTETKISVI